ncbi:MAG TPA: four helix bundle protein [Candidatus Saccharimonadales bacterium]|nr:four helix bundle protein [Candidatus Saccharimonadales bacterium]
MGFAKSFTELRAWQEAHKYVLLVYKATDSFPAKESFGLTSQIRRAAVSITSNIAEGFERGSKKELIQFSVIARASLSETQNQLLLAKDLSYLKQADFNKLAGQSIVVHKLTNAFIRSLRTSSLADKHTSN